MQTFCRFHSLSRQVSYRAHMIDWLACGHEDTQRLYDGEAHIEADEADQL